MVVDRFQVLTKNWLAKAKDDLLWAKDSLEDGHFGGVCFLCQQAVEKALKSYLFFKRQKLIRTHHLERLWEYCLKFDQGFKAIKENCHILNDYYTDTRYPDIWDVTRFDDEKLAKEALDLAKEAVDFVERKIGKIT